jgi:hypothetical protein
MSRATPVYASGARGMGQGEGLNSRKRIGRQASNDYADGLAGERAPRGLKGLGLVSLGGSEEDSFIAYKS